MSTLQTWFLLFWAIVGLGLVVFSPSRKINAKMSGLTPTEATLHAQQARTNGEKTISCGWVLAWLLEIAQTVVVEPGYLLWALLNHVGTRQIALVDLIIVLGNVFITMALWATGKRVVFPKITWFYWVKVFIFSLPTAFLWYLFLVAIGVMP